MNGVAVAVGAEFLQFQPGGGIPAVFHGRVTGNTGRSLVDIGATFGAFQRNNDPNAFLAGHSSTLSKDKKDNLTQTLIISSSA